MIRAATRVVACRVPATGRIGSSVSSLLTTAVAALVGALLFDRLGVPAGALLGAMVAVALVNTVGDLGPVAELPASARFLSYAALGWLVGEGVTRDTLAQLRRAALPVLVVVAVLLVVGLALGWALARLGVMDPATAYLATSPGALTQMAAVAKVTGADAALVTTVHTTRIVVLLVLAPVIGRLSGTT